MLLAIESAEPRLSASRANRTRANVNRSASEKPCCNGMLIVFSLIVSRAMKSQGTERLRAAGEFQAGFGQV